MSYLTYSYIANAINEYCFFHNITHLAFSKLVGVSDRTVRRWLAATVKIPKEQRLKLEQVLNVSIETKFKTDAIEESYTKLLDIDKLYKDFKLSDNIFFQRKLFNVITTLFYNDLLDNGFKVLLSYDDDNNAILRFNSLIFKDSYLTLSHTNEDIKFSFINKNEMITNEISNNAVSFVIELFKKVL